MTDSMTDSQINDIIEYANDEGMKVEKLLNYKVKITYMGDFCIASTYNEATAFIYGVGIGRKHHIQGGKDGSN